MVRVPDDELDFPGWDEGHTHNGQPFTGIAYEMGADGQLVAEVEYRAGVQEGRWREWHADGAPRCEANSARGVWHGHCREWHPNGQLALDGEFEHGVCLHRRRCDEGGALVEAYSIESNACATEILGIYRRMYGGAGEAKQAEPPTAPEAGR